MDIKEIIVSPEQNGLRLDVLLSSVLSSRCVAEKLIKSSLVKQIMNSQQERFINKPSYKVKTDEKYIFDLPQKPKTQEISYYDYAIPIVFEDEHLLVINKPSGIVVHPGPGHEKDTLVNALIKKIDSTQIDSLRPGIVHRLDKDVSGLMIVSKNKKVQDLLIQQFKLRKIKRIYRALVLGEAHQQADRIESFIGRHTRDRKKFTHFETEVKGSKKAITHYKILESFCDKIHHVECQLETGRTHQIRVHLTSVGLPILGDQTYFSRRRQVRFLNNMDYTFKKNTLSFDFMALYSSFLQFTHPVNQKSLDFKLDWPKEFNFLLDQLDFQKSFLA